jgi:hypothetical protein
VNLFLDFFPLLFFHIQYLHFSDLDHSQRRYGMLMKFVFIFGNFEGCISFEDRNIIGSSDHRYVQEC